MSIGKTPIGQRIAYENIFFRVMHEQSIVGHKRNLIGK